MSIGESLLGHFFSPLVVLITSAIKLISHIIFQVPDAEGPFFDICIKTCTNIFAYETLMEGIGMSTIGVCSAKAPKGHNPLARKGFFTTIGLYFRPSSVLERLRSVRLKEHSTVSCFKP